MFVGLCVNNCSIHIITTTTTTLLILDLSQSTSSDMLVCIRTTVTRFITFNSFTKAHLGISIVLPFVGEGSSFAKVRLPVTFA